MIKEKIIFLDYDGVVNTPMWGTYNGVFKCGFCKPLSGRVNNFQAICWLNELYKKIKYKIVVSSSWRYLCKEVSYSQCLYNSGLNKNIEIIGCIPVLPSKNRIEEIDRWLNDNQQIVEDYVVLDDIPDLKNHNSRLVKCNYKFGFGETEFKMVIKIFENKKNQSKD